MGGRTGLQSITHLAQLEGGCWEEGGMCIQQTFYLFYPHRRDAGRPQLALQEAMAQKGDIMSL